MRNTLAIAALGLAALFGIAACGASAAATTQPRSPQHQRTTPVWPREIANIAAGKGGLAGLTEGRGAGRLGVLRPGHRVTCAGRQQLRLRYVRDQLLRRVRLEAEGHSHL